MDDVISTLTKADVRAALAEIRQDGVPRGRGSTKFCLVVDDVHFPPKYVVAVAAQRALGRPLRPDEFSGGAQTNTALDRLGLKVVDCNCGGTVRAATKIAPARPAATPPQRPNTDATKRSPPEMKPPKQPSSTEPTIVRIVARGRTPERLKAEEQMLLDAFTREWPEGTRTKFVLTPGGFVHGAFPRSWRGRSGWDARPQDIDPLLQTAERQLAEVVTRRVFDAARGKADVLTIGIDLFHTDDDPIHAELVAVFDVNRRELVRWTGKSYPTSDQEHTLVHVRDLDTHLLEIAGERALVLGCHDLNMFSPRGYANQAPHGVRRARCDEMKRKVERFRPTIVLQHPHSTDTPNIWRMPWLSLERLAPTITCWASGIGYYNWNGKPRADLRRVRELTKGGSRRTTDIELRSSSYA